MLLCNHKIQSSAWRSYSFGFDVFIPFPSLKHYVDFLYLLLRICEDEFSAEFLRFFFLMHSRKVVFEIFGRRSHFVMGLPVQDLLPRNPNMKQQASFRYKSDQKAS